MQSNDRSRNDKASQGSPARSSCNGGRAVPIIPRRLGNWLLIDTIGGEQRLDPIGRPETQGQSIHIDISALKTGTQSLSDRKQGDPRMLRSEETSETEDARNATYNSIKKILAKGIRQKKPPTSVITKQKYKVPQPTYT